MNQTKNECCPECSTPVSGAPDETQKECLNPECRYCHQTKEGWEEIVNEFFVKMVDLEHKRSLHSNRQIFEGFTDRLRKEAEQRVASELLENLPKKLSIEYLPQYKRRPLGEKMRVEGNKGWNNCREQMEAYIKHQYNI